VSDSKEFSFATFALLTLGAGALVLVLTGVLVVALQGASPVILLILALGGFFGGIAAMAYVSNRLVNRAAEDPDTADEPGNR
jgi:F0F1-type ATP synthase assembly protein I